MEENEGMLMVMVPAQIVANMENEIKRLRQKLVRLGIEATEDFRFSPEARLEAEKTAEAEIKRFMVPPTGDGFALVGPLPPESV